MSDVRLELSPEIEKSLAEMEGYSRANDSKSHALKFDDYGSMHIIDYDEEDKKLQDYTLNEKLHKSKVKVPDGREEEMIDRLKSLQRSNKIKSVIFLVVCFLLFASIVGTFIFISYLGGLNVS